MLVLPRQVRGINPSCYRKLDADGNADLSEVHIQPIEMIHFASSSLDEFLGWVLHENRASDTQNPDAGDFSGNWELWGGIDNVLGYFNEALKCTSKLVNVHSAKNVALEMDDSRYH